ncbi:MAG: peptidoglycan-binding protein [Bacteroidetes bacterium]|nr:peptidoglycan-binding protein [Bacteroidota bacterium]
MKLKLNSKGEEVKALQKKLISLGYTIASDGSYGNQTLVAVKAFQSAHHLLPDGIVGPVTMSIIDTELSSKDVKGIDVSQANGVVAWDTVAAGGDVSFAIIKCTEGATYQDPRFRSNLSELQRVGLTYGAYHFFRFFSSDSLPQAKNLKNTAGVSNFGSGTLPLVVDVEYQDVNGTTNAQVTANKDKCRERLRIFIDQVSQDFGRAPMIYTNADFWNNVLRSPAGFENLPLWVADYRLSQGPALPTGWSKYKIWQYSSTSHIAGVNGLVDVNVMKGAPPLYLFDHS